MRATACFGRHTFAIDTYKSQCQFSKKVLIGNCDDFFIYYLPEVDTSSLRYCSVFKKPDKKINFTSFTNHIHDFH